MWEPHTETSVELVDPAPIAALAALFDSPHPGDELPPLWHWVALPRWPVSGSLGPDGHPARGTFLPPVSLPRRMFAGGEVRIHRPLRIGSAVTRSATVESVTEKTGRSGRLVIVVVRVHLSDVDGLVVEERQDIVYRERGPAVEPAEPPTGPPGRLLHREDGWAFRTDPTLLMRFSAATANAHRIHYDWPYATLVEGYPGLVVHGPLMSLTLAEVLRLEHPDAVVTTLTHRNVAPLFCGQPATIEMNGSTLELRGQDSVCSTLTVGLRKETQT
ncbi:MaoC family dehydratase N-terminal domain-containing protein [Actinocrispum sp. NPDC049592]|uniref:FAS1-like dehydratase domain-containing protein n=1 Tax=Actinocrispum sp. NPDC049592 TaxID=3154835 RepID=UPI00344643C7